MELIWIKKFINTHCNHRILNIWKFTWHMFHWTCSTLHSSYWSTSYKQINHTWNLLLFIRWKCIKHLRGALWMSHVGNFLNTCFLNNHTYLSWKIKFTKFLETIVEVINIFIWNQASMSSRVNITSIISKPNIISSSS